MCSLSKTARHYTYNFLFSSECFSVGVPSLVLSAGTVGLLIGSEETDQVISWSHQYSAWDLLAAITAQLLHTPGVGVGEHTTLK